MKLLLDEAVPRRLALSFPASFALYTVQGMGWAGTANGLLLSLAAGEGFDALITVDRGIEHQQSDLPIPVVVMLSMRSQLADLQPPVTAIAEILLRQLERHGYRYDSAHYQGDGILHKGRNIQHNSTARRHPTTPQCNVQPPR